MFLVRAYWQDKILPSTPRLPNPPGTKIPSTSAKISLTVSSVTLSESIHLILTFLPKW